MSELKYEIDGDRGEIIITENPFTEDECRFVIKRSDLRYRDFTHRSGEIYGKYSRTCKEKRKLQSQLRELKEKREFGVIGHAKLRHSKTYLKHLKEISEELEKIGEKIGE